MSGEEKPPPPSGVPEVPVRHQLVYGQPFRAVAADGFALARVQDDWQLDAYQQNVRDINDRLVALELLARSGGEIPPEFVIGAWVVTSFRLSTDTLAKLHAAIGEVLAVTPPSQ